MDRENDLVPFEAVVNVINTGSCKEPHMMCCLFFFEAKLNFTLIARLQDTFRESVTLMLISSLEAFIPLLPSTGRPAPYAWPGAEPDICGS